MSKKFRRFAETNVSQCLWIQSRFWIATTQSTSGVDKIGNNKMYVQKSPEVVIRKVYQNG